ncbi:nucleosidase [Nocardioides insulae]|uniref:nucleosidase n=1 Tax=Nocardioides insulae TaxID=394734 RepID=UPI0003FA72B5|nr:nucleosidase [Nocardioides insulae]
MTTLVVSATRVEAAHLPPDIPLLVTGIGKVPAAAAVARALAQSPEVDQVINIGSCGALREGLSGVYEAGRVLSHDISAEVIRGLGHDTREWLTVADTPWLLATGDQFVHETTERIRLAEVAHLVDMEGYAVAWACEQAGVPARLVKHVSDSADETALDWNTAVDRSARDLADWVSAHL